MKSGTTFRVVVLTIIGVFIPMGTLDFGLPTASSTLVLASPTITSEPASQVSSTDAAFTFTGPPGATFQCRLDALAFAVCSSPMSYAGLAQGSHTFQVNAVLGTDQSAVTSYPWTVDTLAPPAPTITAGPLSVSNTNSPSFSFTDSESGVIFRCQLDGLGWTACSSPRGYAGIAQGAHSFRVQAVDAAGNVSAATSYSFTCEKGLPTPGLPTSGLPTSGLPTSGLSFQITGSVSALTLGTWKAVAVRISNPNGVVIHVTALKVAVAADSSPTGCLSSRNVELQQSNVSTSRTVAVPANGSVVLPAQGVITPQIRLKDLLTVNQDVCKNKRFTLSYSGTATS